MGSFFQEGPLELVFWRIRNCAEYLELDIPISNLCGHQFMARFYGGDARESPIPEFGAMEIQLHGGGGKFSLAHQKRKRFGNHTTMKFTLCPMDSSLSAAHHVSSGYGNDDGRFGLQFIQRLTTQNLTRDVRKFRRSLSESA